jgi:hypothetical protein
MRLGKEQSAGYVEDTEADALTAQQPTASQPGEVPLAQADESSLTVS